MRLTFPVLSGLAAPLVYAATVVAFGDLTPGYNAFVDPISRLAMPDAPYREWVNAGFIAWNLLLIVFALSFRAEYRRRGVRVPRRVGLVLLFLGLAGIAMVLLFPPDRPGAVPTFGGQMHLILAGASSLATMLAVFLFGRAMRRQERRLQASYAFLTLALIIVSGAFAAIAFWRGSAVAGLWERLTVFAFMLWIFLQALVLLLGPSGEPGEAEEPEPDEEEPEDE
jgi:hypothetical membrane protein